MRYMSHIGSYPCVMCHVHQFDIYKAAGLYIIIYKAAGFSIVVFGLFFEPARRLRRWDYNTSMRIYYKNPIIILVFFIFYFFIFK